MASAASDPVQRLALATAVKIVIAGGFGAGKTTMVGSISEIAPLRTEEIISQASAAVDDVSGVEAKTTTTVAIDFGRITISPELVLYLFGTPGQQRFWFMWDDLTRGALGAVVLVDTRRLDTSFAAVDFFERREVPFMVAVNCFEGAAVYQPDDVREALDLQEEVPLAFFDARQRKSSKQALVTLLEHVLSGSDNTVETVPG